MQQQTLQQIINITVGDTTNALASTGVPILPIVAVTLGIITTAITAIIFTKRRSAFRAVGIAGSRSSRSSTNLRLFTVAAITGASLTTLSLTQHLALAAPTLAITGDTTLSITIPKGGGTATTKTTLTTTTANPTGYHLTASLATAEPGIAISLQGGDVSAATPLTAGATPLQLANTTTANATGTTDTTETTLTFTVDSTVTEGAKTLTLSYLAVDNPYTPAPPAPTTMQDLTKSYCQDHMTIYNGTNEDAILTLTDPRGNTPAEYQTYQVAKLADGNCWMLNNLKLGSTTATTELTSENTNLPSGATFTLPQLVTTGTVSYDTPGAYGPVAGDNPSDPATNYGYLYNWCATMAGTLAGNYSCKPADAYPTDLSGNAANTPEYDPANNASICPANWRLPRGGNIGDPTNEFSQLNAKMAGFANNQDSTYQGDPYRHFANWQPTGAFKGSFSGYWRGASTTRVRTASCGLVRPIWTGRAARGTRASTLTESTPTAATFASAGLLCAAS